jgi:ABC-type tungstate transport system substrate-binding protein
MSRIAKPCLFWSGAVAVAGAVLHVAIIFGGPDWYAFFGAPEALVQMARTGNARAPISCLVIAAILACWAAYAFSGAGHLRRLPFLRLVLALIAAVLILRGSLFIPLLLWRPGALGAVCSCHGVDGFIVVTSILCLVLGVGYGVGAIDAGREAGT